MKWMDSSVFGYKNQTVCLKRLMFIHFLYNKNALVSVHMVVVINFQHLIKLQSANSTYMSYAKMRFSLSFYLQKQKCFKIGEKCDRVQWDKND